MTITNWPDNERPREKLLSQGSTALSDAELLAILLRTGTRGQTAVDLARTLLRQFGGLRALLNARCEEIYHVSGMGEAKHAQLQAILELGKRYLFADLKQRNALENVAQTKQYLITKLGMRPYESFSCLFLDSQFRVITFIELFRGSVCRANVYPGEVVKQALQHHAVALIVCHNHPSGDPTPSQADKRLTHTLKQALALVEIRLVDHIIVSSDRALSLAELGQL